MNSDLQGKKVTRTHKTKTNSPAGLGLFYEGDLMKKNQTGSENYLPPI